MLAPAEQHRREGVAQGVEGETLTLEARSLEDCLVLAVVEIVMVHQPTDAVGKDKAGVPPLGRCQSLGVLVQPVATQGNHDSLVERCGESRDRTPADSWCQDGNKRLGSGSPMLPIVPISGRLRGRGWRSPAWSAVHDCRCLG